MNSKSQSIQRIAEDRATDKIWRHYDPDFVPDQGPWPSRISVRIRSDVHLKYRNVFDLIDTAVQIPKYIDHEMQRYHRARTYMQSEHNKNINALWIF